jgi:hypothetical protein
MAAPPRAKAPGLFCSPPSGQSRRPRYLSEYRLKPRAESRRPVGTKNPGLAPIVPLGQQPTADPSQEPQKRVLLSLLLLGWKRRAASRFPSGRAAGS